jgi:Protein of unknown function (DUF5131)
MIFVNSMSDLFHRDVPVDCIVDVARVMQFCYWHTFQVLMKRSEQLRDLLRGELAFVADAKRRTTPPTPPTLCFAARACPPRRSIAPKVARVTLTRLRSTARDDAATTHLFF